MIIKNLLFEIGTEDLPPNTLKNFSKKIKDNIELNLKKNNVRYSSVINFYTNIRLTFIINDIEEEINIKEKLIKGPLVSQCFDESSNPTKTALGFSSKYNVDFNKLEQKSINGKDYLFYRQPKKIIKVSDIIPMILEKALDSIEDQKKMRWGDNDTSFIRPIKWILLIFGTENIKCEILGIKTCNYTFGNKVLNNNKIIINDIEEYKLSLINENIEIDHEVRKDKVKKDLIKILQKNDFDNTIDKNTLEEVTNMAESSHLFLGKFPKKYLDLPKEVLAYVIQDTQKYFLIYKKNKMTNFFVGSSNVKINKNIIKGNERVVIPRLDDAKFFINKDLKNNIFSKKNMLKKVIFHKKLGSMFDKVERISKLSVYINSISYNDKKLLVRQIAEICKLDLISNMVVEIPKLQGIIGKYYAEKCNKNKIISEGIKDHYLPKNSEDLLPSSKDAQLVSMADKLDTVVGIFLVNEKPTGTRDPLGIRRATNGVLRIILQIECNLSLTDLIDNSAKIIYENISCSNKKNLGLEECHQFFKDKLISTLRDNFGFQENIILSVIKSQKNIIPYNLLRKIEAVKIIINNPSFKDLFSNAKRISNILIKSDLKVPDEINENLLRESSEKMLYNAINNLKKELELSLNQKKYVVYLKTLNELNDFIIDFFAEVMINVEEEEIKLNRLSILSTINNYYNKVANFSVLAF